MLIVNYVNMRNKIAVPAEVRKDNQIGATSAKDGRGMVQGCTTERQFDYPSLLQRELLR
jgi:hypothetical protein